MATGHTHPVLDGEITTAAEFAYECSRSFVWSWRDGNGLRYPEDRTGYYLDLLSEHVAELEKWTALTEEQKYGLWSTYVEEQDARRAKHKEKAKKNKIAILNLLEQIDKIEPPKTHTKFHDFMVNQLEDTLAFDGDIESAERWYATADFYTWCESTTDANLRMVETYSKEVIRARKNYAESVAWIDTLASTYGVKVDE